MALTTYKRLAEQILTTFYKGQVSDDANFSPRHICELIATCVAKTARNNALENSQLGETTFANDTFTSTFTSLTVLTDSTLKQKYVALPQMPAALPNNAEVANITPLGIKGRRRQVVLMKNKDKFMQDLLQPIRGFILAYIENGRLYFDNIEEYMFTGVNITLVGAVSSTGSIVDATLNVSKDAEDTIVSMVLAKLYQTNGVSKDLTNDAISI